VEIFLLLFWFGHDWRRGWKTSGLPGELIRPTSCCWEHNFEDNNTLWSRPRVYSKYLRVIWDIYASTDKCKMGNWFSTFHYFLIWFILCIVLAIPCIAILIDWLSLSFVVGWLGTIYFDQQITRSLQEQGSFTLSHFH
jgi:hypothetical protein